jgi:hypothetical protein
MGHTLGRFLGCLIIVLLLASVILPVSAEPSEAATQETTGTQNENPPVVSDETAETVTGTDEAVQNPDEKPEDTTPITPLQALGAFGFGALIGWYVYFINRYRKDNISPTDLATLVGVLGGGTILAIFPKSTDLFGAYGIGLAVGFFGYFVILHHMVKKSDNFNNDWFLDGRRNKLADNEVIPEGTDATSHPMVKLDDVEKIMKDVLKENKPGL